MSSFFYDDYVLESAADSFLRTPQQITTNYEFYAKIYMVRSKCNFIVHAKHMPGKFYTIIDTLWRLQIRHFRRLAPQASYKSSIHVGTLSGLHNTIQHFSKKGAIVRCMHM